MRQLILPFVWVVSTLFAACAHIPAAPEATWFDQTKTVTQSLKGDSPCRRYLPARGKQETDANSSDSEPVPYLKLVLRHRDGREYWFCSVKHKRIFQSSSGVLKTSGSFSIFQKTGDQFLNVLYEYAQTDRPMTLKLTQTGLVREETVDLRTPGGIKGIPFTRTFVKCSSTACLEVKHECLLSRPKGFELSVKERAEATKFLTTPMSDEPTDDRTKSLVDAAFLMAATGDIDLRSLWEKRAWADQVTLKNYCGFWTDLNDTN